MARNLNLAYSICLEVISHNFLYKSGIKSFFSWPWQAWEFDQDVMDYLDL